MSQSLSMVMVTGLRQEQRLTPQLIQSMDILQLPLAALEARINEELEKNPVLEYKPPKSEESVEPSIPEASNAESANSTRFGAGAWPWLGHTRRNSRSSPHSLQPKSEALTSWQ